MCSQLASCDAGEGDHCRVRTAEAGVTFTEPVVTSEGSISVSGHRRAASGRSDLPLVSWVTVVCASVFWNRVFSSGKSWISVKKASR